MTQIKNKMDVARWMLPDVFYTSVFTFQNSKSYNSFLFFYDNTSILSKRIDSILFFLFELSGRFCKQHSEAGMVDVQNKRCKTHMCSTLVSSPRLRGYCLRCFMHTFPSDPLVCNHKTKERAVVDFVKDCYPEKSWVFDKTIDGGCSKRRPDIFLDMGSEILIIEVDEEQHKSYEDICENKRTMQMFVDSGLPVVLIRFNPDKYVSKSGTVVPSCWGITESKGLCNVKKVNGMHGEFVWTLCVAG
jgi:hypothetical protein